MILVAVFARVLCLLLLVAVPSEWKSAKMTTLVGLCNSQKSPFHLAENAAAAAKIIRFTRRRSYLADDDVSSDYMETALECSLLVESDGRTLKF